MDACVSLPQLRARRCCARKAPNSCTGVGECWSDQLRLSIVAEYPPQRRVKDFLNFHGEKTCFGRAAAVLLVRPLSHLRALCALREGHFACDAWPTPGISGHSNTIQVVVTKKPRYRYRVASHVRCVAARAQHFRRSRCSRVVPCRIHASRGKRKGVGCGLIISRCTLIGRSTPTSVEAAVS